MKPRLLVAAITLLLCAQARTEMITIGGDQAAVAGTLTLNYDLVFTITTASTHANPSFVFDEIVSNDGTYSVAKMEGLEFSVNGGDRIAIENWYDNSPGSANDQTYNDGLLQSSAQPELAINDIVTLHAGTGTMTGYIMADANFNPWTSGDYTVFMANNSGIRLSTDAVPEPATAGLLGISALALYGIRRIKNFNRA